MISVTLLVVIAVLTLAYLARVAWAGRARYERVDRAGGSVFLNQRLMEMAYWWIQPIARGAIRLSITADAVSWTSVVFGLAAGIALALGFYGLGALLAGVAGILDALDGLIARQRGTAGPAGAMLDSLLDRPVEFFLIGGLALHWRHSLPLLALCLLALLGSFLVTYSTALAEIHEVEVPRGSMRRAERMSYLVGAAVLSPLTHPAGLPLVVALALIALVGNVSAVQRVRAGRRLLLQRERERQSRSQPEDLSSSSASVSVLRLPLGRNLNLASGTFGPDMKGSHAMSPHAPRNPK
jgi:phosphatidylglycerophosphate synthase